MSHIWNFSTSPQLLAPEQIYAEKEMCGSSEVFSDALCEALFETIQKGEQGGTWLADGSSVDGPNNLYAVGTNGIDCCFALDSEVIDTSEDVKAVLGLLRGVFNVLKQDSDDALGIGCWCEGATCYFAAGTIVQGQHYAENLARHRGVTSIYSFAQSSTIEPAKVGGGSVDGKAWALYNTKRKAR